MLLPIERARRERHPLKSMVTVPVLLAIAYGASIGGLGTAIGSLPYPIFLGVYREATGREIGFLEWMGFGLPRIAVFIPTAALWLARGRPGRCSASEGRELAPARSLAEKRLVVVVLATVALRIFRCQPAGGWSGPMGLAGANDATIALRAVLLLLSMPNVRGKADRCLAAGGGDPLQHAHALRWETGPRRRFLGAFSVFALGEVRAARLGALPPLLSVLAVTVAMIVLSEITHDTAALAMPVLAAAATSGVDPASFMLPATLAASCAFMLPVAIAPNAVVDGSGLVPAERMAREVLALNLAGIALRTLLGDLRLL